MQVKNNLLNLELYEIEKFFEGLGEPKFRAKQVFQWIYQKSIYKFDDMSNIPKSLQQKLHNSADISSISILQRYDSEIDETKKYLMKCSNDDIIESVLMKYEHGYTVCVSSQVGCRMGCKFCASTMNGLKRNLEVSEILGQIIEISKEIGQRISNIVIMGIGEPFDNFENLIKFLRIVTYEEGLNIGMRHITVSTCGLVPKIYELACYKFQLTLAISLHAPNDELRRQIMPIANKYSIDELLKACQEYTVVTGRRITFEYSLISGVNDSKENAYELSNKLKGMLCHVNLIPVNEVKEKRFKKSSKKNIEEFLKVLSNNKIRATVRRELGSDINASCGQLRNTFLNV